MKVFVLFLGVLLSLTGVVCPLFKEIAEDFFTEPKTRRFFRLIQEKSCAEASKYAEDYANKIFEKDHTITYGEALESFFNHNVAYYIKTLQPKYPDFCGNQITVDLHGLPESYVKKFALKVLKRVEQLQAEPETKDSYGQYKNLYFIPGWGKHTKGGPNMLSNKESLFQTLHSSGYTVQKTNNPGILRVFLPESPIQYEPPLPTSQSSERNIPGLMIRDTRKIRRHVSAPASSGNDRKENDVTTGLPSSISCPEFPQMSQSLNQSLNQSLSKVSEEINEGEPNNPEVLGQKLPPESQPADQKLFQEPQSVDPNLSQKSKPAEQELSITPSASNQKSSQNTEEVFVWEDYDPEEWEKANNDNDECEDGFIPVGKKQTRIRIF